MRYLKHRFSSFFALEASGGFILFAMAILAALIVNSPFEDAYRHLLAFEVGPQASFLSYQKPLLIWVNDGLMPLFFLLIGIEIKREALEGHLSPLKRAVLPVASAVGGMVVPVFFYCLVTFFDPSLTRGWAIPAATDIAFSLAVIALLGSRVPTALKVFLTTVAVADDVLAIIIIGIFYHHGMAMGALAIAALSIAALLYCNYRNIHRPWPYIVFGIVLWLAILESGIHATIAGVILGWIIPLRGNQKDPLLTRIESKLHPWVVYGVLPLFAFFNAGISFKGFTLHTLAEPLPLGIILGLFIGKQLGIFGTCWVMVKLGFAQRPAGCGWRALHAVAVLGGIGFTMSLFIGSLAYSDETILNHIRLGVIMGSILSAVAGYWLLRYALRLKRPN